MLRALYIFIVSHSFEISRVLYFFILLEVCNHMKRIGCTITQNKPALYEQSEDNIWNNPHTAKSMLKAHLDTTLDSATRTIDIVERTVNWISGQFPANIYLQLLDLGCGPGIYTERFHKKGYKVTGIDFSNNSIRYAQQSARKQQLSIRYQCEDYTQLHIHSDFHLITLIYCDFGVLPVNVRKKLLSDIYALLYPQGVFIFDVFLPSHYADVPESTNWEIAEHGFWDDSLCLTLHNFSRYDKDHTVLNRYITITEEQIRQYHVWEHTFTKEELLKDLHEAGFAEITFYKDMSGSPCEENDQTLCITAFKQSRTKNEVDLKGRNYL